MLNTTTHSPTFLSQLQHNTQLTTDLRDPEGERSKKRGRGGRKVEKGKSMDPITLHFLRMDKARDIQSQRRGENTRMSRGGF